ncbi:MAG: HlyD family efflux transporter periplasmic adaptor subunit [Pseudomonadota bacterium]
MNVNPTPPNPLQIYFGLAASARKTATQNELQFLICNDTRGVVPYRQAMLFLRGLRGRWRLATHSGLSQVGEASPYQVWLEALISWQHARKPFEATIQLSDLPKDLQDGWQEWLPTGVLALPLSGPDEEIVAWWVIARDEPWQWPAVPPDPAIWLNELQAVYGHALWAWVHPKRRWKFFSAFTKKTLWLSLAAVAALSMLPVRLSVLAPAEITPLNPHIVSAPMEGVVKHIPVLPGSPVKKGEVVVELDDTLLVNRKQVLEEASRTTGADLLQAEQQAFDDQGNSRGSLSVLRGKVNEKKAELESIARQMERLQIRAPAEGVFIYSDQLDWAGKPLQTGERIGLLADPAQMNVTIWIPASDAINLETGADVKLYLHIAPLKSLSATLTETSFSAQPGPDGVVSYRIKAHLNDTDLARIGLKGTAKIYGERVPLIYLLLRRPLASVRAWSGW